MKYLGSAWGWLYDVGNFVVVVKSGEGQANKNHKFMKQLAQPFFMTSHMMDAATQTAEQLRLQIAATEDQLKKLKDKLAKLDAQNGASSVETSLEGLGLEDPVTRGKWPLSSEEYKRYGRQMIVPNIGIQGQFPRSAYVRYSNLL